ELAVDFATVSHRETQCYQNIARVLNEFVKFLLLGGDAPPLKKNFSALSMGIDVRRKSNTVRQRISKELKCLDASVALQEAIWILGGCRNMSPVSRTAIDLNPAPQGVQTAVDMHTPRRLSEKFEGVDLANRPSSEKVDCMKLVLVLWQKCFEENTGVEDYFVKNDWLELVNSLNGLGLGAAAVLGALMRNNIDLVRNVQPHVVLQFVEFLQRLG
ncbi:unnamed protein product, partial [Amoebophrya sp. A25]